MKCSQAGIERQAKNLLYEIDKVIALMLSILYQFISMSNIHFYLQVSVFYC